MLTAWIRICKWSITRRIQMRIYAKAMVPQARPVRRERKKRRWKLIETLAQPHEIQYLLFAHRCVIQIQRNLLIWWNKNSTVKKKWKNNKAKQNGMKRNERNRKSVKQKNVNSQTRIRSISGTICLEQKSTDFFSLRLQISTTRSFAHTINTR